MTSRLLALLIPLTLVACGQSPSTETINPTNPSEPALPQGSISGTVSYSTAQPASSSDIIPGRILVKFRESIGVQAVTTLSVSGTTIERLQSDGEGGVTVYRARNANAPDTARIAAELAARPDVEYAEPDRIVRPFLDATDPHYPLQWNLQNTTTVAGGINMPGAWDITTGTNDTTIAVIDTGILYRPGNQAASHPDLDGTRILPGYDFISNTTCTDGLPCSGDGDGRDNDPYDPGRDGPNGTSSYHGTFVAGIAGAATNNRRGTSGEGISGVNWNTRLLPVRVLGPNGGSLSDITVGIRWSAGVSQSGVPANPNPADVINLSLGGTGSCPQSLQDAINAALAGPRKPVIVVAAGNSGVNVSNTFPANCQGVITVGATDQNAKRTSYSNYGSLVSVMAPGGNTRLSYAGRSGGGGVLSLTRDDSTASFTYAHGNGTSYAAPHIAGVAALMRAVNPGMSATAIQSTLERTARPVSATNCGTSNSSDCGAGIIDAAAAVRAAQQAAQAPSPSFTLSASTGLTVRAGGTGSTTVNINRTDGFSSAVDVTVDGAPSGVSVQVTPASTTGSTTTVNVTVASTVASGTYALTVQGTGAGLTRTLSLALTVPAASGASLNGTLVGAFRINADGTLQSPGTGVRLTTSQTRSTYTIPELPAGRYYVVAFRDDNRNNRLDDHEYFGDFIPYVTPPKAGIDIQLHEPTSILSAPRISRAELNKALSQVKLRDQ